MSLSWLPKPKFPPETRIAEQSGDRFPLPCRSRAPTAPTSLSLRDERPQLRMPGFSTVDGFMNVNQELEDMIKYVANEPSVGLFFVQQHAQNAMPNLISLKEKVIEKTRQTVLHTEDLEDSIEAVRLMADCGVPIADEMTKEITKLLQLMSTSQPRRGLIRNSTWGSQRRESGTQATLIFNRSVAITSNNEGSSRSYLSTVLSSAKQKAAGLRWPQHGSSPEHHDFERMQSSASSLPPVAAVNHSASTSHDKEAEEALAEGASGSGLPSPSENYELFTSEREARLQQWLEEFDGSAKGRA